MVPLISGRPAVLSKAPQGSSLINKRSPSELWAGLVSLMCWVLSSLSVQITDKSTPTWPRNLNPHQINKSRWRTLEYLGENPHSHTENMHSCGEIRIQARTEPETFDIIQHIDVTNVPASLMVTNVQNNMRVYAVNI